MTTEDHKARVDAARDECKALSIRLAIDTRAAGFMPGVTEKLELGRLIGKLDVAIDRLASLASAPAASEPVAPTWDQIQHLAIKHKCWSPGYGPFASELLTRFGSAPKDAPHWAKEAFPPPSVSSDEQDARRYRWLRIQGGGTLDRTMLFRTSDGVAWRIEESLDTAIDAALSTPPQAEAGGSSGEVG